MKYTSKKEKSQYIKNIKLNFDGYMKAVYRHLRDIEDHDCHLSPDDSCEACERRYL